MSGKKKIKQRSQTNPKTLLIIVIIGLLLIAAGLFFGTQKPAEIVEDGTPAIAVDQELIDFGDVHFNKQVTFEFQVTNEGDGTLRFADKPYIEVRDGC